MSLSLPAGRPAVQLSNPDAADHRRQIAQAVNRINQGHFNCTLFVTLVANAATTTVTDSRISAQTCASFQPQTAHAAAEVPTLYAVCGQGSMTINHSNNSQTDRNFTVGIIG